MSVNPSPNRWTPFQCPSCFGLFRLRKQEVGRIGRCPMCRVVLETSEKSLLNDPAAEIEEEQSKRDLLKKVAVAQEMTPEEIEAQEAARKERRRVHAGEMSQATGWDKQGEVAGARAGSWKVWVSGLLFLLLVAAIGIYQLITRESEEAPAAQDLAAEEMLKDYRGVAPQPPEDTGVDESADLIDRYREFDLAKMEETLKGFLTAETVAAKKEYIRERGRVSPLMDRYYSREGYLPEGFEGFDRTQVSYRDDFAIGEVQTGDFLSRSVIIERTIVEGEERFFIDWESWVGYGEFSPEEMRSRKPVSPFLVRAVVETADYYNYGFSDDGRWNCYGLKIGEEGYIFLGYVPRGSELDQKLMPIRRDELKKPMILQVAYPPKARAKDQLEILEIVPSQGWILMNPEDKDDE